MHGNLRPRLYHLGDVLPCQRNIRTHRLRLIDLLLQTQFLCSAVRRLFKIILAGRVLLPGNHGIELPFQIIQLQEALIMKVYLRGRFIDKVDGLIWQEPLMDVPDGHLHRVLQH